MPIYEYECNKCGECFELRRNISDSDEEITCPKCGESHPKRVISRIASTSSDNSCAPTSST